MPHGRITKGRSGCSRGGYRVGQAPCILRLVIQRNLLQLRQLDLSFSLWRALIIRGHTIQIIIQQTRGHDIQVIIHHYQLTGQEQFIGIPDKPIGQHRKIIIFKIAGSTQCAILQVNQTDGSAAFKLHCQVINCTVLIIQHHMHPLTMAAIILYLKLGEIVTTHCIRAGKVEIALSIHMENPLRRCTAILQ